MTDTKHSTTSSSSEEEAYFHFHAVCYSVIVNANFYRAKSDEIALICILYFYYVDIFSARSHWWAQLTKKLAPLTAISIVKNLASLTLICYFALFISFANASPLFR